MHGSGFEKPEEVKPTVAAIPERYQFTMCQERRPPHTGCWLVRSLVPLKEHALFYADGDAAG